VVVDVQRGHQAADFVTHPSRRDEYDDVDFDREQLEKEERLAGLR
jgi:hypothetical protein